MFGYDSPLELLERGGKDIIPRQTLFLLKGLGLMLSLAMAYYVALWTEDWAIEIFNSLAPNGDLPETEDNEAGDAFAAVLIAIVIASAIFGFTGHWLACSRNALVSMLGAVLTCMPFGLLYGPLSQLVAGVNAADALIVGGGASLVAMLIAAIIPNLFKNWAGYALAMVIGVWLSWSIFLANGWVDPASIQSITCWIGLVVLITYLTLCMFWARDIPATSDNAADFIAGSFALALMVVGRILLELAKASSKSKSRR